MIFDLQKASIWKRISAFLLDAILLSVLAVGFAFAISAVTGYDGYNAQLGSAYAEYEQQYGISFASPPTEEQSEQMASYTAAYEALIADDAAMRAYNMVVELTLLTVSISLLFAFAVTEFAVPLFIKNGQTLGKKVFGVALMRNDGVKISAVQLLIRTLLGKYTLETMVPLLIIIMIYFNIVGLAGTIVLGLILLLQLICIIATGTNSLIHDLLAGTVAVDMASQLIFDTADELIEYKKKVSAEKAASQPY